MYFTVMHICLSMVIPKCFFWYSLISSKDNFLLKYKQVLLTRFTKCTTSQNTFQSFPTSLHGFIVMILMRFHIDIHVHPMESELWVQNCCKEIHFVTKRLFLGIFRGWSHLAVQEDSFEPPLQRCQQCHYQRLAVAALISSSDDCKCQGRLGQPHSVSLFVHLKSKKWILVDWTVTSAVTSQNKSWEWGRMTCQRRCKCTLLYFFTMLANRKGNLRLNDNEDNNHIRINKL